MPPQVSPCCNNTPLPPLYMGELPKPLCSSGVCIRIYKEARRLYCWKDGLLLLCCPIGLGFAPVGDKEMQGDGKTPEGSFYICSRKQDSRFHLALGISYPGIEHARRGLSRLLITQEQADAIISANEEGRRPPWGTALGGEIMIHGMGACTDWTAGCIATENEDMDVLWDHVPLGTPVIIEA